MISFPLLFVSRALSFLSSFRLPSFSMRRGVHFRSVPYLFSFLRFWLLACVVALFVSCAGGGSSGGGSSSGGSDSRPPFELVDPFINGTSGGYLEFRSAATFSFNVTCPPFCEEREVLFFRSSTDGISLQDDEIGRENVSLNVSDNTRRLSFPFAAGLPGTYYYGVCIGAECSVAEEIIVAGLAVTGLVTNATELVENDDVLRLTATVSCFGPKECPDINVSYYRAIGNGTAVLLEPTNRSVPPLTLSNMTEDFSSIDDTVDYTKDTRYYACLGSMMPSQEISYGEDDGTCSTLVVRLDDDDGDGVSRRNDVDDDGDGLIEIGTAAELDAMRYELTGSGFRENATATADMTGCPVCSGYELTADIDLESHEPSEAGSAGWRPIGNVSAPFVADFSGNNFTIRNLYINRSAENGVGLFGRVGAVGAGTELQDVRLVAVDVSGQDGVGGLVGAGTGVTIIASSVTGMVSGQDGVGGLVGDGNFATITASSMTGMVNGTNSVGGLVGAGGGATIIASYSMGTVSGGNSVGGLLGDGARATIIVSYAAGPVSGNTQVGGLLGDGVNANITASYAAGDVGGSNDVGGLVGDGVNANITASYAAGDVSGNNQLGGLVGDGTGATIILSYWDRDANGQNLAGFGEPLSTLQLQFPLAELQTAWEDQLCPASAERAWDFGEVYQYPALTCPPSGVAVQDEQRTLPAFVGLSPADISSPTVDLLTVDGVNTTISGMSAASDGAALRLTVSLSCAGSAPCVPAQVDYYVSADDLIDAADTLVGTAFAPFAQGGGTTVAETNATLNAADGILRYYGACVGDVCAAGTALLLQTDPQVPAVRLEGPASRILSGSVSWVVNLSCPGACLNSLLFLRASTDVSLTPTDDLIETRAVSLDFEEVRTDTITFTLASSGYYGLCTPTECFADSVVRIIIDADADGVAAAEDLDDDGDGLIEIGTADELNNIRYVLNGSGYQAGAGAPKDVTGCPAAGCSGYELVAPIDLASYGRDYDNGAGWEPVGSSSSPFTATFAGNDFPIHNLTINRPTKDDVGFFGALNISARVRSVSLADIEVTGMQNVGGLVGTGRNPNITASYATGNVSGAQNVGGLVGDGEGATITASYVTGNVRGTGIAAGGLVGNGEGATITASYAIGNVNGAQNVGGLVGSGRSARVTSSSFTGMVGVVGEDSFNVGGLVGDGPFANIITSYVSGSVGGRDIVGGLVGLGTFVSVTASYMTGSVRAKFTTGGLVASGPGSAIIASYAVGTVRGGDVVGGLVGTASSASTTASYWDSDVSGITSGFGSPQTTAALQFPLAELRTAWEGLFCPGSVERAWDFGESYQYPALTCPPGGVAAQYVQRTLPAFVGLLPADIFSPALDLLTVEGVNITVSGVSAAKDGEELRLTASLSCAGSAPCLPVQVDYYVSADDLIDAADTLVGTAFVPFVRAGGTTFSSVGVTMDAQDGFSRYYGACVGDVCTAGTELLLQTDTTALLAVRLEGPASRSSQGGDEVTWLVDIPSCSTACLISFSVYASRDDGVNVLEDEKIEELQLSLNSGENGTFPLSFTPTFSGYYGLCTLAECFAASVVRMIINNPNDQDDADGVAAAADVDDDGDGLIEIGTADELNNIRYVLDGSGYRTGASATKDVTGCPAFGCSGYELTADIDLASYGRDYDNGAGWEPVGDTPSPFTATFAGNDFPIHNLTINRSSENQVGFFGVLGSRAFVQTVSLVAIEVRGAFDVGGLAGRADRGGRILSSAVTGRVVGAGNSVGGLVGNGEGTTITAASVAGTVSGSGNDVGGLVGDGNGATITASYAAGMVRGLSFVGGLVGDGSFASITASYATGMVSGLSLVGGLVGEGSFISIIASYAAGNVSGDVGGGNIGVGALLGDADNSASITASYWDSNVSGITSGGGSPQTTAALQSPTGATGIYADWDDACPNDETMDNWDFGTATQYPVLNCTPDGAAAQRRP